mmetsp:Transcript_1284/g.2569  ORF Transcript_1284/g.2569 Transcript_1284/m.2569 type:complete len:314 (-) Transcript_1284:251-1192(-)
MPIAGGRVYRRLSGGRRPIPVELARAFRDRPVLVMGAVELQNRGDLVEVACHKNLVRSAEIIEGQHGLGDCDAIGAEVGDVPLPRDSVEESAIGDRGEGLSIADHEDVGRRGLGDVAHRVTHQRVVVALGARFHQHPRIVRVETARLRAKHCRGQHRAMKLRCCQPRGRVWRGHGDFFKANVEPGLCIAGHDPVVTALDTKEVGAHVDRDIGRVAFQPFPDDVEDLLPGLAGVQGQRLGGAYDTFAMGKKVRREAVDIAGTVKDRGCLPGTMIGRAHDGNIVVMPSAVEVSFDVGSGRHCHSPVMFQGNVSSG